MKGSAPIHGFFDISGISKKAIGTRIARNVQNNVFDFRYDKIKVFVDENNFASLSLFEKVGFTLLQTPMNREICLY
ncbi:MAG: GNAT family N-acetyltransferase [Ruminococcaceae bacterium]|nr:GNAT family N-acetyltransferase [Oscillospiraceae bacterium]